MTQSRSSNDTWATTVQQQADWAKGAADSRRGGNR
jgi:hypothetical protein